MRNQEANETVEANMGKGGKQKGYPFAFPLILFVSQY
jgi:hypothetical protein